MLAKLVRDNYKEVIFMRNLNNFLCEGLKVWLQEIETTTKKNTRFPPVLDKFKHTISSHRINTVENQIQHGQLVACSHVQASWKVGICILWGKQYPLC